MLKALALCVRVRDVRVCGAAQHVIYEFIPPLVFNLVPRRASNGAIAPCNHDGDDGAARPQHRVVYYR